MTTDAQFGNDDSARLHSQPGAIGQILRETRESYQQDIATVSQQLRIRGVYLRAIEAGDYKALPGSTYAVGFVRSYAEYLGLDPLELVRRFREEAALVNSRTQLVFPVPTAEAKVPSGAILLVAFIIAVLAYGGWYYISDQDRDLVDMIPAVPESLKEMVNTPVGTESESEGDISASSATAAEAPESAESTSESLETLIELNETAATAEPSSVDASADEASAGATAASSIATADAAADAAAETGVDAGADAESPAETDATEIAETAAPESVDEDASGVTTESVADAAASDAGASLSAASAIESEPLPPPPSPGSNASADGTDGAAGATQISAIPEAPRVPEGVSDGVGFGAAFGGSRVVIVARMESWIEVQNANGEAIWGRVLRAGDRYLVPDEPGLTMTVGNAGGIDVFVDGGKAPSLGSVGVGRRGVMLDPERLASGTALP
jgi:cytoskeleton protein RodZ